MIGGIFQKDNRQILEYAYQPQVYQQLVLGGASLFGSKPVVTLVVYEFVWKTDQLITSLISSLALLKSTCGFLLINNVCQIKHSLHFSCQINHCHIITMKAAKMYYIRGTYFTQGIIRRVPMAS